MNYRFDYSEEKDAIVKETRGIGFKDIIEAIKFGNLLDDRDHPNQKKYPGQKLFVVKIDISIYAVPYIIDHNRRVFFLKTAYRSRKLAKEYEK